MPKVAIKKPPEDIVEEFFDVEQGSEDWLRMRIGLPTASNFAAIMASGKDGKESAMRRKLLYQLAGEILSGEPAETYSNAAMQRGKDMEGEARDWYGRTRFADLTRIGFVRRTVRNPLGSEFLVGCSPDAFVGEDGILEVKTLAPHLLIELADRGTFPTEHKHQCHGSLWVTGRSFVDLVCFYRGMPITPTFRIERDTVYIKEIENAVEMFTWDLRKLIERIRAMSAR